MQQLFELVSLLLGGALYFIFWILALLKLVKQEGGFPIFIKYFIGTGLACIFLSVAITIPVWNCHGFLCGLGNFLVAMAIDIILVFVVGIVLYRKALNGEKGQSKLVVKKRVGYEDILDDMKE